MASLFEYVKFCQRIFVGGYLVNKYFKYGNVCMCVVSHCTNREVWMSLNHIASSHISNISLTISSSRIRSHFSHFTRHQHHALFLRCEVNGVHTLRCQEEYEWKIRTHTHSHTKLNRIQELTRCEMFMPLILSQSHTHSLCSTYMRCAEKTKRYASCVRAFVQFGRRRSVWQYSLPLTLTLNTIIRISLSGVLHTESNASWLQLIPYWYGHISDITFSVAWLAVCGAVQCTFASNAVHICMLMLMFFGVVHSVSL